LENVDMLLIDEIQDLSVLQWKIIKSVVGLGVRVSIAGDHSQAIYGFRGAPSNFRSMLDSLSIEKEYSLNVNRRSSPQILALANWINETCLDGSPSVSCLKNGKLPSLSEFNGLEQLCDFLVTNISKNRGKGSVLILVHTTKMRTLLQEALGKSNISVGVLKRNIENESEDHNVLASTIHGAKGTKANTVFLIDPRFEQSVKPAKYDEEKLIYVAVTRAQNRLFICKSTSGVPYYSDANQSDHYILDRIPPELYEFSPIYKKRN
jgi:superfamily I DNA/RNA helicase